MTRFAQGVSAFWGRVEIFSVALIS